MGKLYSELNDEHIQFIAKQKIFFVGTATAESRVNVSPKGIDSLKVLGPTRVVWLNVTGSGNETAAHVRQLPRMTIMFCSFEAQPLIMRLYGKARVIHYDDPEWQALADKLAPLPGARQIFDLTVELVQTSCGMGVPYYAYQGERGALLVWAEKKGTDGVRRYWAEKNRHSIDGIDTGISSFSQTPT